MRKLCPNYDREDGLETVLEVPMPEEMFGSGHKNGTWQNVKSCLTKSASSNLTALFGGRNAEIQILLGVAGAPLIPLSVNHDHDHDVPLSKIIRNQPIEAAMAKYIVKQYTASVGGDRALNSISNMFVMGKVKMGVSEFCAREGSLNSKKMVRVKNTNGGGGGGEMGGFVLWQRGSGLWSLELVVSGFKISAGSDGKVAWRQTPWHSHSHSSRGPPTPLRRFLQGLDPKSTASLFTNSICSGEKTIDNEDCFVLKLEAEPSTLRARSDGHIEIVRHTIRGCFSQRTGLLVQLEDTQLLSITGANKNSIFWETTTESLIQDYRTVDGVQIAHKGKTVFSLFRSGESSEKHSRTRIEEVWEIEEVGFNVKGLSSDCFLAPSDLNNKEHEEEDGEESGFTVGNYTRLLPLKIRKGSLRVKSSKVTALDFDDEESDGDEEDESII